MKQKRKHKGGGDLTSNLFCFHNEILDSFGQYGIQIETHCNDIQFFFFILLIKFGDVVSHQVKPGMTLQ